MKEEKKLVRITDDDLGDENYLALTEDQERLLEWLSIHYYFGDGIHITFNIEMPEFIEI